MKRPVLFIGMVYCAALGFAVPAKAQWQRSPEFPVVVDAASVLFPSAGPLSIAGPFQAVAPDSSPVALYAGAVDLRVVGLESGEPQCPAELMALCRRLDRMGKYVTVGIVIGGAAGLVYGTAVARKEQSLAGPAIALTGMAAGVGVGGITGAVVYVGRVLWESQDRRRYVRSSP